MRKITLIFILLLSVSTGFSQDIKTFRFGLKGAPNISWMKPDATGLESGNPRLKFSYGLMTEFFLSDNYIFSTGVEILNTGGKLDFRPQAFYVASTNNGTPSIFNLQKRAYNFQYLNIPLLLKMRTNEIGYFRYYGQFGLDAGFNTKARADDSGFYTSGGNDNLDVKISDNTQFFRMALNLGLGFEYNLIANTNLMVGLTYSNGFTNALKRKQEEIGNDPLKPNDKILMRATTNLVALNVGIFF